MNHEITFSDAAEIATRLGDAAQDFTGKTVVFTGGGGFLGRHFNRVFSHLNEHVLDTPCQVLMLDNFVAAGGKANWPETGEHIACVNHNVIEPYDFDGKIDFIFHAASIASPFFYRAYPLETLDVATKGTRMMLDLAREHDARLLYFSSSEIYGDPDPVHVPTPESYRGHVSCRGPRACYDESKRVAETLTYIYHQSFGTAAMTVRPFNVYGPGMGEKDYRVMPNFASSIKGGRALSVYGTGNQTRTFCYLTDALTGFLLTALKGVPGEAYNIGNPKPEITMLELVQTMEKVLGHRVDYRVIEYPDSYPADEPLRRCPDITKARNHLGYNPEIDLEEGLRRYLGWTNDTYTGEP